MWNELGGCWIYAYHSLIGLACVTNVIPVAIIPCIICQWRLLPTYHPRTYFLEYLNENFKRGRLYHFIPECLDKIIPIRQSPS